MKVKFMNLAPSISASSERKLSEYKLTYLNLATKAYRDEYSKHESYSAAKAYGLSRISDGLRLEYISV